MMKNKTDIKNEELYYSSVYLDDEGRNILLAGIVSSPFWNGTKDTYELKAGYTDDELYGLFQWILSESSGNHIDIRS